MLLDFELMFTKICYHLIIIFKTKKPKSNAWSPFGNVSLGLIFTVKAASRISYSRSWELGMGVSLVVTMDFIAHTSALRRCTILIEVSCCFLIPSHFPADYFI